MHAAAHQYARRDFLRLCSVLGLGALVPSLSAGEVQAHATSNGRILVLIELDGGNDGLNTVVPVEDPLYYEAREVHKLAVAKADTLLLPDHPEFGLHPSLANLHSMYQDGDLAIVHGVGYADNNRSHFRGIDIWNTGSDADVFLETGWMGRLLAGSSLPAGTIAEATILRRAGSSPVAHDQLRTLAMSKPEDFIRRGRNLQAIEPEQWQAAEGRPGLLHLLQVHQQVLDAVDDLSTRLFASGSYAPPSYSQEFPSSGLGQQLRGVADLICSGAPIPVHKVGYAGFDTHASQVDSWSPTAGRHANLLRELDEGMAAFRAACIQHGMWDRVLVMTYSEFGRRVAANASRGTDHGGAACHFCWGGEVIGGLYGTHPSLAEDQLRRGDLVATTDFRQLYTSAASYLGLDPALAFEQSFTPVPCVPV